ASGAGAVPQGIRPGPADRRRGGQPLPRVLGRTAVPARGDAHDVRRCPALARAAGPGELAADPRCRLRRAPVAGRCRPPVGGTLRRIAARPGRSRQRPGALTERHTLPRGGEPTDTGTARVPAGTRAVFASTAAAGASWPTSWRPDGVPVRPRGRRRPPPLRVRWAARTGCLRLRARLVRQRCRTPPGRPGRGR